MNDEFLSKNLRILFNDKSSIGLDRGGDIRAFPFGESHIYMQLLEGYQNVDFAKQSLPYNNISMTTIPLVLKHRSKMVLNFEKTPFLSTLICIWKIPRKILSRK